MAQVSLLPLCLPQPWPSRWPRVVSGSPQRVRRVDDICPQLQPWSCNCCGRFHCFPPNGAPGGNDADSSKLISLWAGAASHCVPQVFLTHFPPSPTIHDESSIYQPLRQNKTWQDPCPEKDSQTVQASVASPVCEFLLGSNSRPLVLWQLP